MILNLLLAVLCLSGCIVPYLEMPKDTVSFLQATPMRSTFGIGEEFDPVENIAVYKQEKNGGIKPLSFVKKEFSVMLVPPEGLLKPVTGNYPLTQKGFWTVTVSSSGVSDQTFTLTVTEAVSGAVSPLVQVIPQKTNYAVGETVSIRPMDVYIRNITSGNMEPLSASDTIDITVLPDGTDTEGLKMVMVTVTGYPTTTTACSTSYYIEVGAIGPEAAPLVQIMPLKAVYVPGDKVSAGDMVVYKRNLTSGEMETLSAGAFEIDVEGTDGEGKFTAESVGKQQTVTVTVPGYDHPPVSYTVMVSTAVSPSLVVMSKRPVYLRLDEFTPVSGLEVYLKTETDTMEKILSPSWTRVTIMPPGETTAVNALPSYTLTKRGNYTVTVEALGITGSCDLWVTDDRLNISSPLYVDGTVGKIKRNTDGDWEVSTGVQNKIIYSFTTLNELTNDIGQTCYIRRVVQPPIKLNLSAASAITGNGDQLRSDNVFA